MAISLNLPPLVLIGLERAIPYRVMAFSPISRKRKPFALGGAYGYFEIILGVA
jgi:hypothetical protein